ncbi:MAG: nicotinate-nucleotide--dimethylbenzimidazole phosphoribosyltransferase [Hyphomicrobium sp.]
MTPDFSLEAPSDALRAAAETVIRGKAKPVGAFGRLEQLAADIVVATGTLKPDLGAARLIVFAADHGLTAEGVTAYPSEITGLVAGLILAGTGGANITAKAVGVDVMLVDCGMLTALPPAPMLLERRIASGTRNARREPAMTAEDARRAFDSGCAISQDASAAGVGIFALGEIGIGNTSAAALVAHAATRLPLDALVGPGAGAPPGGLDHKRAVLKDAFALTPVATAWDGMVAFGGFEMVTMLGAMFGAARAKRVVIVDGYIATAVAAVGLAMQPALAPYLVYAHNSAEPAHALLLAHLGATPLFDLGMRLGEGTGAALAVPMVRAAALMLTEMADLAGAHPT